jgi:uncharacterized LabA/DUF88 family protein
MSVVIPVGPIELRRIMIFIDGAYLRKGLCEMLGHDRIDFAKLRDFLIRVRISRRLEGELIRVYYYDAMVEPSDEKHEEQKKYFDEIRKTPFYQVRLGRLVKTEEGNYRQKGVDILISVDMLTKAYQNHYDIAVLVGGDDDLVDLVNAIKDWAGKRVYGFYFPKSISKRLLDSLDEAIPLKKGDFKDIGIASKTV